MRITYQEEENDFLIEISQKCMFCFSEAVCAPGLTNSRSSGIVRANPETRIDSGPQRECITERTVISPFSSK